jgi:hypothetical protein
LKQNVLLFAVVGLLAGAAIGTGIGYFAFGDSSEQTEQQTYWYFIDYGAKADDGHKNGWISGSGSNSYDAFKDAAAKAGIPVEINDNFVNSINGIEGGMSEFWVFCAIDTGSGYYSGATAEMVASGVGLSSNAATISAFVYGEGYDSSFNPLINEPMDGSWRTTGPFEAE